MCNEVSLNDVRASPQVGLAGVIESERLATYDACRDNLHVHVALRLTLEKPLNYLIMLQ